MMSTATKSITRILLLAVLVCMSNSAFAELTQGSKYLVVHGSGDGSGKSDLNGGSYKGSVSWSDFQDANGGPVDIAMDAAISDNGAGLVRITSAGSFDDAMVDIFTYCEFDAAYTDGRYAIVAVDPAANYIDIDLAYISDTQVDANVGGAFENIQTAVDSVDQGDCVKVSGGPYTYAANGTNIISCSVAVDTGGSPAYAAMWNSITIEGVNEEGQLDWDDKVVLDCTVNSIETAVDVAGFYCIKNLEIIGAVSRGIGRSGVDNVNIEGCAMRQCGTGVFVDNNGSIVRCIIEDSDGRGVYADNNLKVIGCVFRNNADGAVRMNSGEILYTTVSNNQTDVNLINISGSSTSPFISGCTLDGGDLGGTVGINLTKISNGKPQILNNIIVSCETGMSANSDVNRSATIYNNLFHANVADVNSNGFIGTGANAVFGDPCFADAASGDYRLTSDSAAIGMGFDCTLVQFGTQDLFDQAPTGGESKTIVVHGSGDGSGKSDTNGGAFRGDVSWSEFQGSNGGPLDSVTGATVSIDSGTQVRISATGGFASSIPDVYVYCDFSSVYDDGIYAVTAVDPFGDYIDIDLDYIADSTADVNVGGALATPQKAVDIVGQGDYVKIAGGPYTTSNSGSIINCSVAVDTSATSMNMITIEGVNEDGVIDWDDKVLLDCTTENASYGISYPANYRIRNFEIVGATNTGMGNNSVDSCIIEQCVARESSGMGLRMDNGAIFLGCESYDNGSNGLDGDGAVNVIGCIVRNNRNKEVEINYGMVMFSTIASDGQSTTLLRISEQWVQPWYMVNNTFDGNSTSGIIGLQLGTNVTSTAPFVILNNNITNCEDGIYSGGDMTRQSFTYNNLYYNNVNDVSLNGNIGVGIDAVFDDPGFADPSAGDYSLDVSSPALNAGFDSAWDLYGESGMSIGASGIDIGSHQYLVQSKKPGDANNDGVVNLDDFIILKQNYGSNSAEWSSGDFNGDGTVNLDDFIILKQNYGK